jgi:hypothetical protein
MSTQVMPTRTDLPPPMRHLLHDERPVGWLSENTLGFSGFADPREAANAAWVAYRTVSRKVAPLLGVRPTPVDTEPLAIEWRGGREMIVASGRPFAELVRPDQASLSAPRWFGFAIEVSPAVPERAMPEIMRTASRALLKSGIPWSMLRSRSRDIGSASRGANHMRYSVADRKLRGTNRAGGSVTETSRAGSARTRRAR